MPLFLSPVCNDQTFDANGDPLNGGQIETYLAGSSTPAATYTDDTGSTPHSNPIILNTLGYPTLGPIWLTGGISYKFIIKNAAGSTLRTIDNISGVNDASVSQSEWVESGFVPTYIGATSFSVPGDQTPILQVNRRLRTTNTSGFIYSTITNSVFAAGITTVTVANSSGVLDAGLSSVAYGLMSATNSALPIIQTAGLADDAVTTDKLDDGAATYDKLGADVALILTGKNLLINGNFAVNQRAYVSGAATGGANQYTLDRWRVVTSGQNLAFTASANGYSVTAPAGGLEQVIEGACIEGGSYVLNWTGTATATVNGTARTKGEVFTLAANTNATVRLINGTASLVQLEIGQETTQFELRPLSVELMLCQRYFYSSSIYVPAGADYAIYFASKATMRATPTVAGGGAGFNSIGPSPNGVAISQTVGAVQTITATAEL